MSYKRGRRKQRRSGSAVILLGFALLAVLLLVAMLILKSVQSRQDFGATSSAVEEEEDESLLVEEEEDLEEEEALEEEEVEPVGLIVCVDAGHGGKDPGTEYEDRVEKDDDLAFALALQAALEARGVTVVMTREDDTFLYLRERVTIAEEANADYFISIHRNYFDGDAYGIEMWVAENCSESSLSLATLIKNALVDVGVQRDRGVGSEDYYVITYTTMPAVLIELGYMQDTEDNRLFDEYLTEYAEAVADAVLAQWELDTAQ